VHGEDSDDEEENEDEVCINRTFSPELFVATIPYMRRQMYISSSVMGGERQRHQVLNDTGASFCAVSKALATTHRLHIHTPSHNEPQYIKLAEKDSKVKRIGYVEIDTTIHFSGGTQRQPYVCRKRFEVMNMHYPFILGVDLLPKVFPHDEIMDYIMLPSSISSPPQPILGSGEVKYMVSSLPLSHLLSSAEHPTMHYDYNIDDDVDVCGDVMNEYVCARMMAQATRRMVHNLAPCFVGGLKDDMCVSSLSQPAHSHSPVHSLSASTSVQSRSATTHGDSGEKHNDKQGVW
jgi:hypothetical protein